MSAGALLTNAAERIYISQHPAAWGKRIALQSTHPNDTLRYCEIQSVPPLQLCGTGARHRLPEGGPFGIRRQGELQNFATTPTRAARGEPGERLVLLSALAQ